MASKRGERRRSCSGKQRYEDAAIAERERRRLSRRLADWVHTYHCPFCGRWHLGHVPYRMRQAIAARKEAV